MENLAFEELERDSICKKGYIKDLDQDGNMEMILLVEYPEIEKHTYEVLVYTFTNDEKAKLIYKYESSLQYGADYSVILDIGIDKVGRLYLIEEANSLYTAETTIGYIDKVQVQDKIEAVVAYERIGEFNYQDNVIDNCYYNKTNAFQKFIPLGSNPENFEYKREEINPEEYFNVRNNILSENEIVLSSDQKDLNENFVYNKDENNNIIYPNYDREMLSEKDFEMKLLYNESRIVKI